MKIAKLPTLSVIHRNPTSQSGNKTQDGHRSLLCVHLMPFMQKTSNIFNNNGNNSVSIPGLNGRGEPRSGLRVWSKMGLKCHQTTDNSGRLNCPGRSMKPGPMTGP
jgi:hypothetical protein